MKRYMFILMIWVSCKQPDTAATRDPDASPHQSDTTQAVIPPAPRISSNQWFKNVSVIHESRQMLHVKGKAQVFEAAFSWMIRQNKKTVLAGHTMTDAGAPAFGKFDFVVNFTTEAGRECELVLYEASPRDGSMQHQLVIPLD